MEKTNLSKRNSLLRKTVYAALFLALAMVLPFLTGQIPEIGAALSPLHIPAILCGFVCGWPWGLVVGFLSPLMRSLLFIMPPMHSAIPMAFEIGTYGAVSGLLYRLLPAKKWAIYVSLVTAMTAGRLVWGLVRFVLAGLEHSTFPFSAFLAGAVLDAVPGIILHIVLIPLLVMVFERAHIIVRD